MKNKKSEQKKREVHERIEKLDPNNPDLLKKPLILKKGKIMRDDGFEHRTSEETAK